MFRYDARTLTTASGVALAAALDAAAAGPGAVLPPHAARRIPTETRSASVIRARKAHLRRRRTRRSIVIPFDHPCGSVGRERRRRPRLPPRDHLPALRPLGAPPSAARGRSRAPRGHRHRQRDGGSLRRFRAVALVVDPRSGRRALPHSVAAGALRGAVPGG